MFQYLRTELTHFWQHFTQPKTTHNTEIARCEYMTKAILTVLMFVASLGLVLSFVLQGFFPLPIILMRLLMSVLLIVSIFCWLIVEYIHWRVGAYIIIGIATITAFNGVLIELDNGMIILRHTAALLFSTMLLSHKEHVFLIIVTFIVYMAGNFIHYGATAIFDATVIWLGSGLVIMGLLMLFFSAQYRTALQKAEQYAVDLEVLNADLATLNTEVKQFTYIVSHDLRAPLINLHGYSEELQLALRELEPAINAGRSQLSSAEWQAVDSAYNKDIPDALGFIESSVNRMDDFIRAVLKLSRLGHRELHFEHLAVRPMIDRILQSLGYQLKEHNAEVSIDTLPDVYADHTAVEQIFGNLLTNAVLYLLPDRPGHLVIHAESNFDDVTFHISDNGRGIAPDDYDKVFAPFRRAGTQDVPGTGMGLPYVQTMVRQHGGRIWFKSEFGVGTTFSFTLPSIHRSTSSELES